MITKHPHFRWYTGFKDADFDRKTILLQQATALRAFGAGAMLVVIALLSGFLSLGVLKKSQPADLLR